MEKNSINLNEFELKDKLDLKCKHNIHSKISCDSSGQ